GAMKPWPPSVIEQVPDEPFVSAGNGTRSFVPGIFSPTSDEQPAAELAGTSKLAVRPGMSNSLLPVRTPSTSAAMFTEQPVVTTRPVTLPEAARSLPSIVPVTLGRIDATSGSITIWNVA